MSQRIDAAVSFTRGDARRDAKGHLVIQARLARTGSMPYATHSEEQPATELFAEKTLASLSGAPITDGHEWISPDNIRGTAVGYVRAAQREGKLVAGEEHLLGEVVIFDRRLIADVESGALTEFSLGTYCEMAGLRRTNIRVNHVAILPRGGARCGESCEVIR